MSHYGINNHNSLDCSESPEQDATIQEGELQRMLSEPQGDEGIHEQTEMEKLPQRPEAEGNVPSIHELDIGNSSSQNEHRIAQLFSIVDDSEPAALRQSVRHLMRYVPSSVAVVTAAHVDPGSNLQVPLGIAVSSLSTVTLEPPTISFNVKYPSQTLEAIRAANGRFRVHFLDTEAKSASIATSFTKGNHPEAFTERRSAAEIALPIGPNPPRILDQVVVAALECELSQEVTVADHVILVATVSSVCSQKIIKPTLTYLQGKYATQDQEMLHQHEAPATLSQISRWNPNTHPFWSLPLFPGEVERDTFIQRLRAFLESNPELLDMQTHEAISGVNYYLNVKNCTVGVSLAQIIVQSANEHGRRLFQEPWARNLPIKYKFYGSLSTSDIASIINNIKKVATDNIAYLSMHQRKLFSILGVDPLSTGMLASDLLAPLRDEGLLPPFDPGTDKNREAIVPHLEHLEQIEYKVREYLRRQGYSRTGRLSTEDIALHTVGENPRWQLTYLSLIRARLHVETAPELFDASKCDVSGHVSLEEARVVIHRILSRFWSRFNKFRAKTGIHETMRLPWWEVLRRNRIHPLISGIDPQFLYGKVKYFLSFQPSPQQVDEFLRSILKPWFKSKVEWTELEILIDKFARNAPLRAITWSQSDILAALGLNQDALVNSLDSTLLESSSIVPILLNEALKKHYGPGTEGELEAVVHYLTNGKLQPNAPPLIKKVPVLNDNSGLRMKISKIRGENKANEASAEKRKPSSDLEHVHLNFRDQLVDLKGKDHGFKAYGLTGERKA